MTFARYPPPPHSTRRLSPETSALPRPTARRARASRTADWTRTLGSARTAPRRVRPVVAQLDEIAIMSMEELEEPLPGLRLPRRRGRSIRARRRRHSSRAHDRLTALAGESRQPNKGAAMVPAQSDMPGGVKGMDTIGQRGAWGGRGARPVSLGSIGVRFMHLHGGESRGGFSLVETRCLAGHWQHRCIGIRARTSIATSSKVVSGRCLATTC